mgnify:CR=1 FL=1
MNINLPSIAGPLNSSIQIISDNITVRLVSFFKTKEDISESKTDTN